MLLILFLLRLFLVSLAKKKSCPASFFSPVVSLARKKQSAVHTLGASAYKAHDQFSRKKKDFKCALWSVKFGKENFVVVLSRRIAL